MMEAANRVRNAKGITLIEMMIAVVIALIGAMGGYSLFLGVQGTMWGNEAIVRAQQEARNVGERIARELRESATEVAIVNASDYITFYVPRDENKKFVMERGKVVWKRAIYYGISAGNPNHLERREYLPDEDGVFDFDQSPASTEIVAKNIDKIVFGKVIDPLMVTINVRAFAKNEKKFGYVADAHADYYTMVKLRN